MRVKQRLRINSAVSAVAVLVILAVLILTIYRVNRALEASKIADAIQTASFERLMLRTDFFQAGSERSKAQLIAKHKQIGDLLKTASSTFSESEDKKIVNELLAIHESIGKITTTIRENLEKRKPHTSPDPLVQEIEGRLFNQLNMRVYETILLNGKLQESGNKALISVLRLAGGSVLFVLLLISATTLINSWTMGKAITDRIRKLRDGAAVIGGGDLDHRIDIRGDDEFVELSEAINAMTARLRGSYQNLEKEIEERKQAEEKLLKTAAELLAANTELDHSRRQAEQAEEEIKASLAEKEVMLREIHHRVKNNLQVISSLVSLQADTLADEEMRVVFDDVHDRVRAMALVHEKLYQTGDLAQLNFADYTASLLQYLWRAHGALAEKVRLNLAVAPLALPIEAAVPCGLILNELAGNALKHAFPNNSGGEMTVELEFNPATESVCLRVCDNGVGLPPGLDWRRSRSLGLRLVQMLAGQLHGTMETGPGPGAEFRVTFPLKGMQS